MILIHYTGYVTIKDSYVKVNSVNPSYFIISKANGYFEEINKYKYLALLPTNGIIGIIKKIEELWSKILIRPTAKNSYDYDKKYMKTRFNLDDDLPLNRAIETYNVTIVVMVVFFMKIISFIDMFF